MTAYLIDGYNLLHAIGLLHGHARPQGLEKARCRLIGMLQGALDSEKGNVTVVFDAAHAPSGAAAESQAQGIHVLFAVGHAQADDLIEQLIQHHSNPRELHVVSDDRRLQRAARRRHAVAVGCLDFVDELHRSRPMPKPAPGERPEKDVQPSPAELEAWLREFGSLERDPGFKELFDPQGFRDPEA